MSCAPPCCVYQLLGHLLDFGDEVGEELGHVLLLAGVQRLFVHGVGLTEGPRVVGLPLALLSRNNNTEIGMCRQQTTEGEQMSYHCNTVSGHRGNIAA